ncbi:MAG: hypothetical protein KME11_12840 [Timaviella obliquedivisa GSE-PSE-MK23-08B]|nr:hypothetical protein [Timaviella obliquedivisa GSE-PSE-MK23-08B]
MITLASLVGLMSCDRRITTQYEATATVTYTWQVEYSINPDKTNQIRREKFASTSLINKNGERPGEAVTGPDDRGLWYPALPPRPTVDEIEARQKPQERISQPELLKDAAYTLTYESDGQTITAPTNYDVYRTVVKALPNQQPLALTLGIDDKFVQKADVK